MSSRRVPSLSLPRQRVSWNIRKGKWRSAAQPLRRDRGRLDNREDAGECHGRRKQRYDAGLDRDDIGFGEQFLTLSSLNRERAVAHQEHPILSVDDAAPEIGAAYGEGGDRCLHRDALLPHRADSAGGETKGAACGVERALADSGLRV